MGPAALAHDDHRTAPRRGLRAALAARRLRAGDPLGASQQRADEGRDQGEGDQDPAEEKVALDPQTLALLAAHRELWKARCESIGCTLDTEAFLFSPAPDGSQPYAPRSISQKYRRLALKLKLRSTRLHALRHYSATELVAAGVDLRTVAGRLGHREVDPRH